MTTDDGDHWIALANWPARPRRGPADTAFALLNNEYVQRLALDRRRAGHAPRDGNELTASTSEGWVSQGITTAAFAPLNRIVIDGQAVRGTPCGLRLATYTMPVLHPRLQGRRSAARSADHLVRPAHRPPRQPLYRPDVSVRLDDGRELPAASGCRVQQSRRHTGASPSAPARWSMPDRLKRVRSPSPFGMTPRDRRDGKLRIFSVYYHNSSLAVKVGQRVAAGAVIARVGNTGRATNDHLHLEVHASPTDSVPAIVDSLQRFPPYTTNPELWIEPLPGTGIVAGQVFNAARRADAASPDLWVGEARTDRNTVLLRRDVR